MRKTVKARLLEQELSIAQRVQAALLPRKPPELDGWRIAFHMVPTRTVGGDLVQFFHVGGRIGIAVADVAGKGIPAAILVGAVNQMLHDRGHLPPEVMVEALNTTLCETTPDEISVAMTLAWIDPDSGDVVYCNAGNPAPLVYRGATGTVEAWRGHDLAMGWLPEERYGIREGRVEPGDTLLLYTDGLMDALDAQGERIDEEGVEQRFRQSLGPTLEASAERLRLALLSLARTDDATFVMLRRADGTGRRAADVNSMPEPVHDPSAH